MYPSLQTVKLDEGLFFSEGSYGKLQKCNIKADFCAYDKVLALQPIEPGRQVCAAYNAGEFEYGVKVWLGDSNNPQDMDFALDEGEIYKTTVDGSLQAGQIHYFEVSFKVVGRELHILEVINLAGGRPKPDYIFGWSPFKEVPATASA